MNYLDKILKLIQKGKIKTKYSHYNLIYRRLRHFIFSVDCSGLIEFWLSKKYPHALAEVYDFVYQIRPVAKKEIKRLYSFDFYDFFNCLIKSSYCCWEEVKLTAPLCRGDIIAFVNPETKGRFGHVAIVAEELARENSKIMVRVYDSSQIEHIEDFRQSNKRGIGHGIIELNLQQNETVAVFFQAGQIKTR